MSFLCSSMEDNYLVRYEMQESTSCISDDNEHLTKGHLQKRDCTVPSVMASTLELICFLWRKRLYLPKSAFLVTCIMVRIRCVQTMDGSLRKKSA
jgi:hypothetical protein